MKRLHLFELHDQGWCPAVLRRGVTDFLSRISRLARLHEAMVPHLERVVARSGAERIVDLCSGSGGPLVDAAPRMARAPRVLLTDRFPHSLPKAGLPPGFTSHPEPVDARRVELPGLRTICNAFHHFEPETAGRILEAAVDEGQPIAIFEVTHREPAALASLFLLPLVVLLVTPFLRPRPGTLLFTYLVPVLPLVIAWDGMVSHLRTYSVEELRRMTAGLGDGWTFEASRTPVGPGTGLTVLLGWPTPAAGGSVDGRA